MQHDEATTTSERAREQLAASTRRGVEAPRDRLVHALGVAVFGVAMGAFVATRTAVTGTTEIALTLVYALALVAVVAAVERHARTVPRRARRWWWGGLGLSLALALTAVYPWLNLRAQAESPGPLTLVLAALVVAVPSLAAASAILAGRR